MTTDKNLIKKIKELIESKTKEDLRNLCGFKGDCSKMCDISGNHCNKCLCLVCKNATCPGRVRF